MTHTEWMVRSSGRFPGKHYIDIAGQYLPADIAAQTGLELQKVEALYRHGGGSNDNPLGVWFFDSRDAALGVIRELESLQGGNSGKTVFLTYEELDYIRQALINEGSNVISVRNELKKRIFDKFNK